MKNLAFAPAERTRDVTAMSDVFRADKTAGEWVKTSVSLRPETKARLKVFAVERGMRIQEIVDEALTAYISSSMS